MSLFDLLGKKYKDEAEEIILSDGAELPIYVMKSELSKQDWIEVEDFKPNPIVDMVLAMSKGKRHEEAVSHVLDAVKIMKFTHPELSDKELIDNTSNILQMMNQIMSEKDPTYKHRYEDVPSKSKYAEVKGDSFILNQSDFLTVIGGLSSEKDAE